MIVRISKFKALIPDHVEIVDIDGIKSIIFTAASGKSEWIREYGFKAEALWLEWFTRLNSKKRVFDIPEWIVEQNKNIN